MGREHTNHGWDKLACFEADRYVYQSLIVTRYVDKTSESFSDIRQRIGEAKKD